MTPPGEPADVERFRGLVARRLGLHFDDTKLGFLYDVLTRRIEAVGSGAGAYLTRLDSADPMREELRALAEELTVTETYFFRNPDQFRAFGEVAVPERMRARASQRLLRILSAGCASGEEPYSLAILLRERVGRGSGWRVDLRGVDLNPNMLERARQGRYSPWSLRETPPEMRERCFRANGRDFILDEETRNMATFEDRNLAEDDVDLWPPDAFDIVFCRNVVMYFTPDQAQKLVAQIARALSPGGFLFLGHAETLRGLSQDFHLRHTHGTFYYQRRDTRESLATEAIFFQAEGAPLTGASLDLWAEDSWVEAVRRSSERIESLEQEATTIPVLTDPPPGQGVADTRGWDLGHAVDLLRRERFVEALALIRALPSESSDDPEVLLLRAALLTHTGKLTEAEHACAELLAVDEVNAGAHYLTALCREGVADRDGAIEHDQAAVYLDPGFAMARFHLGLLARRRGDREGARRELGRALVLLQREDPSRLILFGGGFGREALVALCRAELVACGGTP